MITSLMAYAGWRPQEGLRTHLARYSRSNAADRQGDRRLRRTEADEDRQGRTSSPSGTPGSPVADTDSRRPWRSGRPPLRTGRGPWRDSAWHAWHQIRLASSAQGRRCRVLRPYDLRHSFVLPSIREGRSIVDVARQVGHPPTMTLDVYAHDVRRPRSLGDTALRRHLIWEARGEDR